MDRHTAPIIAGILGLGVVAVIIMVADWSDEPKRVLIETSHHKYDGQNLTLFTKHPVMGYKQMNIILAESGVMFGTKSTCYNVTSSTYNSITLDIGCLDEHVDRLRDPRIFFYPQMFTAETPKGKQVYSNYFTIYLFDGGRPWMFDGYIPVDRSDEDYNMIRTPSNSKR